MGTQTQKIEQTPNWNKLKNMEQIPNMEPLEQWEKLQRASFKMEQNPKME